VTEKDSQNIQQGNQMHRKKTQVKPTTNQMITNAIPMTTNSAQTETNDAPTATNSAKEKKSTKSSLSEKANNISNLEECHTTDIPESTTDIPVTYQGMTEVSPKIREGKLREGKRREENKKGGNNHGEYSKPESVSNPIDLVTKTRPPFLTNTFPFREKLNLETQKRILSVTQALQENEIFPEALRFATQKLREKKHPEAIILALERCHENKPDAPFSYCEKIVEVESGNFYERDHNKSQQIRDGPELPM